MCRIASPHEVLATNEPKFALWNRLVGLIRQFSAELAVARIVVQVQGGPVVTDFDGSSGELVTNLVSPDSQRHECSQRASLKLGFEPPVAKSTLYRVLEAFPDATIFFPAEFNIEGGELHSTIGCELLEIVAEF